MHNRLHVASSDNDTDGQADKTSERPGGPGFESQTALQFSNSKLKHNHTLWRTFINKSQPYLSQHRRIL